MQKREETFTIDELAKIKQIEDIDISPNGKKAAFVVKSMKEEENKYKKEIYVTSTTGGEEVKLTENGENSLPRWSPDGKWIAFIKKNEGKRSIWLMDSEGRNKRKIVEYELSNAFLDTRALGETLRWSPDGSKIAFLASQKSPGSSLSNKEEKIQVINRIMYKSFYDYSDMRRRHIFIVSPLGHESPTQLTFDGFDEHSLCWSPDGKEIAFVSNRTGKADQNMHTDIWAVNVESKEIRRITETKGAEYYPMWSPDGKKIAYLATKRPYTSNESTPEDRHVWVVNSDGDEPKELTGELDKCCLGPLYWTPDGDQILFTAYDRGTKPIYGVTPENGKVTKILKGKRWVGATWGGGGLSVAKETEKMIYTSTRPTTPGELYSSDLSGEKEVKLTNLNSFVERLSLSEPEEFTFRSFDDTEIHGWIMKPKGFDPSKKYPTLLYIKGGPSGQNGYKFNPLLQIGSLKGYVHFYINYRGCSGYGQDFSDAVIRDMGGGEFKDHMEAVDYILKTREYVDAENVGLYGGSYGGYLTNWIVTQTNRFKAAVSISSISNFFSDWGTSAVHFWVESELEGLPWDHMDLMIERSPIVHADKVKTPVLFLQGEKDFCTPFGEAEQMFKALKKIDVETKLVRYLNGSHGLRKKPVNRLDSIRRLFAWFDKHLKST